jgi:sn-glycerol 3-phosphate transport system substrate-binding protein
MTDINGSSESPMPKTSDGIQVTRRRFLGIASGASAAASFGLSGTAFAAKSAAKAAAKSWAKTPSTTKGPTGRYAKVKAATEITYWSAHPAKSKPVEEILIKRFTDANPGIKVNLQTAGANYAEVAQRFNAAIAAKQLPDLVMLSDVWWFKYALAKAITPLDELIAYEKMDISDFQTVLVNDYKFNNAQWALPFARSTPLFYYNKRLWESAGLPDRGPDTWAEFETWAPKLQEKLGSDKFPFSLVKATVTSRGRSKMCCGVRAASIQRPTSSSRSILPRQPRPANSCVIRSSQKSMRT